MTLPSTDRAPSGPSTYRIKRGTKLSVRSHKLFPFFPFLQLSFFPSVHSQEIVQADKYPLKDISTSVPPLSSLDGPFQLAEYLSLKIRNDPHVVKALVEVPSGDGSVVGKPERDVVRFCLTSFSPSLIVLCSGFTSTSGMIERRSSSQADEGRRIPIDLTPLLTQLLGICVRESCPQMKADEWLYLCVAHGGGGTEDCCAIDYILHTYVSLAFTRLALADFAFGLGWTRRQHS